MGDLQRSFPTSATQTYAQHFCEVNCAALPEVSTNAHKYSSVLVHIYAYTKPTAHPTDHSALQRHSHTDWSAGPPCYLCTCFFTQCQFLCQQMNVCCRGQPVSLTEATLICLQLLSLPSTRPPRPPVNSSLRLCEGRDFHLNPLLPSLAPGLSGRHCAGAEPLHPVRSAASGRRDASPAVGRRRALLLCCGPFARLRVAQASAHCGTASEARCFLPPHPAPKYSTSS